MIGTEQTRKSPEPLVTKRSLGWAGVAAFMACAACCALPMLAVGGAGLLGSLASVLAPGRELIAGLVAAGVTIALLAVRSSLRRRSCETACATDGSCCPGATQTRRAP